MGVPSMDDVRRAGFRVRPAGGSGTGAGRSPIGDMRSFVGRALALGVLAVLVLAPEGVGATAVREDGAYSATYSVSGAVHDGFTGLPVPAATIGTNLGAATIAGPDGTFALHVRIATSVVLQVTAPGYHRDNELVALTGNVSNLTVTLAPFLFPVAGLVIATNGSMPVAGATVSVTPGNESVPTAENGSFQVWMPNGTFTLSVVAPGIAPYHRPVAMRGSPITSYLLVTPLNGSGIPPASGGGVGGSTAVAPSAGSLTSFVALAAVAMVLAGVLGALAVRVVEGRRAARTPPPGEPYPLLAGAAVPDDVLGAGSDRSAEARRGAARRPRGPGGRRP